MLIDVITTKLVEQILSRIATIFVHISIPKCCVTSMIDCTDYMYMYVDGSGWMLDHHYVQLDMYAMLKYLLSHKVSALGHKTCLVA